MLFLSGLGLPGDNELFLQSQISVPAMCTSTTCAASCAASTTLNSVVGPPRGGFPEGVDLSRTGGCNFITHLSSTLVGF